MPNKDERREIAARLREAKIENLGFDGFSAHLGEAIDECVRLVSGHECLVESGLNRLADLIEPDPERTCHKELMVWFYPATDLTPQREVEYFGCSKCGEWLSDTDCYGLDDGPFYCSNCGCKVDPSFVTDEVTGEVIYRDGAKVVSE